MPMTRRSAVAPVALLALGSLVLVLAALRAATAFAAGASGVGRPAGRAARPAAPAVVDAATVEDSEAGKSTQPATADESVMQTKMKLLRMAASLDRGQAHNPTSGEYYAERLEVARGLVDEIVARAPPLPTELSAIDGEWELVFSTVKHGIFRSSPFFLAVQESFGSRESADLFFKLHELQVMSWGISKVGRVAQYVNSTEGKLYSEFDTSLLSLTTIPILGFWKLLPTFGGCVVTASDVELDGDRLRMEVQYTEAREVPGLPPLGGFVMGQRVPVNHIWKQLPWNNGRAPTCSVALKYLDNDMRIVADEDGEYFIYTRPVDPRGRL